MKILEVKLENFKSYDEKTFEFTSGANAICGPNGSGKTSIIEAISWALFDYIPYKNQDNLIKMTKSELANSLAPNKVAKVQVTFMSDLDSKEYTVYRNTRRQYYIVEKLTNERIAESKREVAEFLIKHYNLSPTANLEEIFTNTIGVPQGTFTAIFLDTPANRKKVFDKLLNLEDYRKAYDNLKEFKDYLKDLINEINLTLAKYYTDINRIPDYETNIKQCEDEIAQNNKDTQLQKELILSLTGKLTTFDNLKKEIDTVQSDLEKLQLTLNHIDKELVENKKHLDSSQQAKDNIKLIKHQYENYLKQRDTFKLLETKKTTFDKLSKDLNRDEKELQNILNAIQKNQEKLETIEKIKLQIKELEPQTNKQLQLEQEKDELNKLRNQLKENETTLKYSQAEITELQTQLKHVEELLAKSDELKPVAESYENLNKEFMSYKTSISEIESLLNENKTMSTQVTGGLCPFLKAQCKNITDGQDLGSYFKHKIKQLDSELNEKVSKLKCIETDLKKASKANEEYKKLQLKEDEKTKIQSKLTKLNEDINNTQKIIKELAEIPIKLDKLIEELNSLGSPKDRIAVLKQQTLEETALIRSIELAKKNKASISKKIESYKEQMSEISFDEDEYTKIKSELSALEEPYQKYLKLEVVAKDFDYYKEQFDELQQSKLKLNEEINSLQMQIKKVTVNYNPAEHAEIKLELENNKIKLAKLEEYLKAKKENLNQFKLELIKLQEINESIKLEKEKLDQLSEISGFIDTSREIYKSCGPQIGQFYIENISQEANILYRDVTEQQSQELSWGLDYEITVEEGGYSRPFVNLSGGEQMSAALAVRLSLMKELSDINIAFFDEPTTNMDETRRSNLALQIKNITNFDQLFIISHDDTFEKDIDYVIRL